MVKLEISLNDSSTVSVEVEEYNASAMETALNNREFIMMAIGNAIFNKQMIRMIRPVENVAE